MISKKELYIKSISRRVFWTQFILFALSFTGVFSILFYYIDGYYSKIANISISKIYPPALQGAIEEFSALKDPVYLYVWPVLAGLILFFTITGWLIIRFSVRKNIEKIPSSRLSPPLGVDDGPDPELEKRKFLHLIGVLQEEGRFLDFLNENLDEFEDDEIGAAVRSVHKGCKDSLKKYLDLKPLIDQEEDTGIDIEKGFNPDEIKLTGKVVGEPPFKGIVRHRGWMADNVNLPQLRKTDNASFLVPAEVEVE